LPLSDYEKNIIFLEKVTLENGCGVIYSEDIHGSQLIDGLSS